MTRYVTLAYGNAPEIYRQSIMLLVSLVAYAPQPCEFLVATDRPERYVWFGTRVEIEYLDQAVLASWRGPDPFSRREKIAVLRAAWPAAGAVVFLDADVLVRSNLQTFVDQLHDGALFMHKREYRLSESRRAGNRRLWQQVKTQRFSRGQVTAATEMWNSGVIAAPAADRALIEDGLAWYDDMAARGIRHFATEQLVEGLVFGRTGRLREAQPWFLHYWGNKSGYDAEIARRLADAFIEGMSVKEAADAYARQPIDLPAEVRPDQRAKLRRWLGRR